MESSQVDSRSERGAPRIWYDLSGLANHSGNVTGITRAVSGVARALMAGASATPTHFCVWRARRGRGGVRLAGPAAPRLARAPEGRLPRAQGGPRQAGARRAVPARRRPAEPRLRQPDRPAAG